MDQREGAREDAQPVLETGSGSPLHLWFAAPPGGKPTWLRSYVCPFAATVLLFSVVPLVIASLTLPTVWTPAKNEVTFLRDWAIVFLNTVTVPLILVFLLTERALIPDCVEKIVHANVLSFDHDTWKALCKRCTQRFFWFNIGAQGLGVVGGAVYSWVNYQVIIALHSTCWQGTVTMTSPAGEPTQRVVNLPGWVFLIFQLPGAFLVAALFLGRAIATVWFLHDLVKTGTWRLEPFHADQCAGLRPVGRIGLRNQYVVAAAGLTAVLGLVVLGKHNPDSLLTGILAFCGLCCVIGGPFVFAGPVLPFRREMLAMKEHELAKISDGLRRHYAAVVAKLAVASPTKADISDFKRFDDLRKLAERIPVWPFDTRTLRGFIGAYLVPLAAVPVSALMHETIKLLVKLAGG